MINEFERKINIFLYNSLLKEFANMFKLSTALSVVRLYDYEIQNLASISYAVENNISTEITMAKIIAPVQ
jgi:hypothetical protein